MPTKSIAAAGPAWRSAHGSVLKIDGDIGLHPGLNGMETLLENRQLAIVQGVGYPNPNRSHFESMDIWHTAHTQPQDRAERGWLGRALRRAQARGSRNRPIRPAMHLGEEVSRWLWPPATCPRRRSARSTSSGWKPAATTGSERD